MAALAQTSLPRLSEEPLAQDCACVRLNKTCAAALSSRLPRTCYEALVADLVEVRVAWEREREQNLLQADVNYGAGRERERAVQINFIIPTTLAAAACQASS